MEIQKVNNLEELKNLAIGTRVLVEDRNETKPQERVYQGETKNLIYSFLDFNLKYPEERLITDLTVEENTIIFYAGAVHIRGKRQSYMPNTEEHKKKLKIIQGGVK